MEEYYKSIRKYIGSKPLILPGAVVLILNKKKQILLQKRSDNTWGLPGGLMNIGESFEETALREVKEETGLQLKSIKFLDVFSGKDYYFKIDNGDEIYSITAVYMSTNFEGNIKCDDIETKALEFFDLTKLPNSLTDEYRGYITPFISILLSQIDGRKMN